MSTTYAEALPAEFLLQTTSTIADVWKRYVLVRKTTGTDGKYRLILSPYSTIILPTHEILVENDHYEMLPGPVPLMSTDNATLHAVRFRRYAGATVQIHGDPPRTIPILATYPRPVCRDLLGKNLRANYAIAPPPPPTFQPTAAAATIEHVETPSSNKKPTSKLTPTIEHVETPVVKKAVKPPHTKSNKGDLAPFVAKQLLALAKLRHEECPIVAEEFSEGNTAVMPCGHLFAQIAIEESFKKTPNTCPACRVYGRPTFV
jgi:hypothetical protein